MRDKMPTAVRRRAGYDELERAVREHDRKLIEDLKKKRDGENAGSNDSANAQPLNSK